MKYIKLFEEWLLESDPLADIMGSGGEGEPKEDPLEKKKKEEEKKEKKQKEKVEKFINDKVDKVEKMIKDTPEISDEVRDNILAAIKDEDRVKIHNAVLDLIYMQQDYAQKGNTKMVDKITPLKDVLDDLDKSHTTNKNI